MNEPDAKLETDLDQSEIQTRPPDENETPFFPVSEGKLITLYILSFGLYGIYWFQQNWKRQQPMMDKKIYPVWRAVFSIFFTHSLFKRIDQQAVHSYRSKQCYRPFINQYRHGSKHNKHDINYHIGSFVPV